MFSLAMTQSCMLSRMTFGFRKSLSPTSIQDSDRLDRTIRDQALVKFPGAVRGLIAMRPLLVGRRDRIREYAAIELGVIPRHDECRRAARAAAHRRPAFGILRQLHVVLAFDQAQHFRF